MSDRMIPQDYKCAITREIMVYPVMCSDGNTYERYAIERWFEQNNTSPLTGETLSS